jgi:Ser/Thr protein kinase RdoA (MazF antagonist)
VRDRVLDGEIARDDPPPTGEAQREVMTVGAELELEVLLVPTEQEELDDLELPEAVATARRPGRRRIAMVRGLDLDLDRRSESELEANELVRSQRLVVPGPAKLEAEPIHVYTPPPAIREGETQVSGAQTRDLDWLDGTDTQLLPTIVRAAWTELAGPVWLRSLHGGLLHQSFHVRTGDVEYVLQRVADVFSPAIHANIQAVSRHLVAHGLRAARLLATRTGELSADLGPLGRWRLMEHLGGACFERLTSLDQARSAGALVGRFHAALLDFEEPLAPMGIPYRDTPLYLAALRAALARHGDHRLHEPMARRAVQIFEAFERLGPPPPVRERVIHGDLKLSNLLFESASGEGRDRALALVDFDTLMRGTLWMELGDLWRSWCNAAGEDAQRPRFDLEVFAASGEGFAAGYGAPLEALEVESLAVAPERITLELCARFVTDALEERYFGWDEARFATRGDHNAARAEGQWQLYEAMRSTAARRRALLRVLG